jgi:ATP-dependent DNA ligase
MRMGAEWMKIQMKTRVRLFHRKTNGTIKEWECWWDGVWVHSKWGVQGGKTNHTQEKGGRVLFMKKMERKMKKGYVESLGAVVSDIKVDDVTFNFNRLPKSFAPAKPIKKVNVAEMTQWAEMGLLFIQRKRDGMRHTIVSDDTAQIRIYSSGKVDVTEHLKPLLAGFRLPPCTVLDAELVCTTPKDDDQDGFLIVSGIARSLPERARVMIKQAENNGCKIELLVFDLLWDGAVPSYRLRYEDRYRRLAKVIEQGYATSRGRTLIQRMPLVAISPTRLATLAEAIDKVKKHKWEGLVLWRKDQATVVQVNGTPKRVNCWKLKPVKEDDVIATGYELGKGKYRKVVGTFHLAFLKKGKHPHAPFQPMGNCGGGLDDETRKAALGWKYPCVIQIEYDQRSSKGFRFPVFKRKRDDKKPTDCVV